MKKLKLCVDWVNKTRLQKKKKKEFLILFWWKKLLSPKQFSKIMLSACLQAMKKQDTEFSEKNRLKHNDQYYIKMLASYVWWQQETGCEKTNLSSKRKLSLKVYCKENPKFLQTKDIQPQSFVIHFLLLQLCCWKSDIVLRHIRPGKAYEILNLKSSL